MKVIYQGKGMSNEDNNNKKLPASETMADMNAAIREEILDKLISYAKKLLPSDKAKLILSFIPHYFGVVPIEDLTSRSIADWYGAFMSHWKLIEKRKPHECKIQVYNPQTDRDGWQTTHTVIDASYDDMPFLVDSMRVELNRLGFTTHLMINLGGIKIKRDKFGEIVDIFMENGGKKADDTTTEAVIHMEIDRETDSKILEEIKENLLRVLEDVKVVVEDWEKMREQLFRALDELDQANIPINREEIEESKAFLRWLINDHFTFLGYRAYEVVGKDEEMALRLIPQTGLGVLRDESKSKVTRYFKELPPKARKLVLSPNVLIISKTNTKATVHRYSYTDYIGVKRFDTHGKLIGERRFIGLFTSEAYNSNPQHIPFLRLKVETVLEKSELPRTGHGARALRNILATLPRDDLFQANTDELYELAMGIYQMQERRKIRLFVRKDPYRRFFSCLVFVPRDNFNTELLYKMRDILQQGFHGTEVTFTTHFSQSILARIHFVVRVDSKKPLTYDLKDIENRLIEVGRSWKDDLRDNLLEYFGEEQGNELINRYTQAFPAGYRDIFSSRSAIYDIEHIERLRNDSNLEMSFYRKATESTLRFKLFHLNSTVPLSDALPMLENMGLRVLAEQSYEINLPNGQIVWINDFTMTYPTNPELNVDENRDLFQDAFYHVWRGDVENDSFNRLVLKAQLNAREITVFRAYAKYFRQIGFTFSQQYIEETLVNNSSIAVLLMQLFKLRFDPKQNDRSESAATELEKTIKKALDTVANLDQDRIIRRYLEIILATLRTNYFQIDAEGKPKTYLSFKFDPKQMPEMPLPLPLYEIFVYSTRFEGVHLRAGKVARGGIRWSDRREDFRTEVLGLMKAQQVKNAVIVPAGAKGGFVPKNLPPDGNRDAIMQEAITCYKNFIRGLLDITDNYSGTEVLHPQDTIFYDPNDPYLVVAADKGTASFSDIANSIAKEYNFWLDDAFASGGSTGYDHKKMAITSRGVWESVNHHFQQLAIDINNPFTVVGIGDMSGDVFGNGMLLSKNIKLVAAFNGDNIFVDPNPDPETSYTERKRLFSLPRSSWEDYNRELISKGGGVYKRSAKSIPISSEVKTALDLKKDNVEPNDLIRAILKAPVDLIWNGGIGTYVKSTYENNLEVGDRANDAIRINGTESRFKVVGEGGNLGWTQLGRIEYALQGGKINTDFIDNSAGVDCSDHEVNIKILLNESVTSGKITEKQRNNLLAEMTEEVAKLVLHDNYRQVRTITLAVSQSLDYLSLYIRYIEEQERLGNINRQLEFLPDRKMLLERKANNRGLTRPEIAVLMAYSKIILKEEILKSGLAEDSYLLKYMELAFPQRLSKKFSTEMQHHRLRKEIIATQLSNAIVNDMGIVFVYQMQDETGVSAAAVAQAYAIMREVFNVPWLLQAIDALDENLAPSLQLETTEFEMMLEVAKLVRRAIRWLLKNRRPPYDIAAMIGEFSDSVAKLYQQLPQLLVGTEKENFNSSIKALVAAQIPEEIAIKVASSRYIYSALNIIDIVKKHKVNIHRVAAIYFILADRLELVWFREKINSYPVDNRWSVLARSTFKDELDAQQRALTISVLQHKGKEENVEARINVWLEEHKPLIERWQSILADLRSASAIDSSMLLVALHALSDLAEISIHDSHIGGDNIANSE